MIGLDRAWRRSSRGASLPRLIVLFGLLAGVTVAATLFMICFAAHQTRVADIRRELESLALVMSEHLDRVQDSIDRVERSVAADLLASSGGSAAGLAAAASGQAMSRSLIDRIVASPELSTLVIVAADGSVLGTTRDRLSYVLNLADRDYIQALKSPAGPSIFVSAPVISRATGQWTIYLARRIASEAGEFLGAVVAPIELERLQDLLVHIGQEPGRAISLIRNDGVLLARYPDLHDKIGASFATDAALRPGPHAGSTDFVQKAMSWDGVPRFVATRRSSRFPTIVNVSSTVGVAMRAWTIQRNGLLLIAALLEAGIVVTVLVALRQARGRELRPARLPTGAGGRASQWPS